MKLKNRSRIIWPIVLLAAWLFTLLAACSGGEHLLLAEFNQDREAEIFLAEAGAPESESQSLAEDAQRAFVFPGELAAFVPGTDQIVLWYVDGNDLRVEHMKIGDQALTELLEADSRASVFGEFAQDPFGIYMVETEDFVDFRCYVSLDGVEVNRTDRSNGCVTNEHGTVLSEFDGEETTVTLVSLDGEEETVILDEVENVGNNVHSNEDLTLFAYVESEPGEAQLFRIAPGDVEGEEIGDEFATIDSFGFLNDGETLYVIGREDEDDEEFGLFINAAGDALLEAPAINFAGQPEDGDYALFITLEEDEMGAFVYSIADGTMTEVAEEGAVELEGFVNDERFLLSTSDEDEIILLSVSNDGSSVVELLETVDYEILFTYMNKAADQLLLKLSDDEQTQNLFVTSLDEENGYFLLEEWATVNVMSASDEYLVFAGREDEDDEPALFSIAWSSGASEVELDDDAELGYRNAFFAADGRSIYYTIINGELDDSEVLRVPVDGSARPESLYRDMILLDVSWQGERNLQLIR